MRIVPLGHKLPEEEHQRRMKLYRQGLNNREIAELLGVSEGCIGSWANRCGLVRINKRRKVDRPLPEGWKVRKADMPPPAELAKNKRRLRSLLDADW